MMATNRQFVVGQKATKRSLGLVLAAVLIERLDTGATYEQVEQFSDQELTKWLESLGYYWFQDLWSWDRI